MADLLIVKAKIKDVIGDYNVSGDFAEELDGIVRELVKKAAARAEGNNRRTVMAKDL
jgi:histone H3/H4